MSAERHSSAGWMPGLAMVLVLAICGVRSTAAGRPLTRLEQVTALSNLAAAQHLPVELTGTVTYARATDSSLYLTDGPDGLYVQYARDLGLQPGDRVQVTGTTDSSFRPVVMADSVRLLGHGALPNPVPATFSDLMHARLDCRFVTVSGTVLAAAYDGEQPYPALHLRVRMQGGTVDIVVMHPGSLTPDALLGAEIRVNGTAGGDFDSKMDLAGIWINVADPRLVTVLHPAKSSVWSIPLTPIQSAGFGYQDENLSERVRIEGTLTYFEPGSLAVIQRGSDSMLLVTQSQLPLHAGDAVEATGFPQLQHESVRLINGQLRRAAKSEIGHTAVAREIPWDDASAGRYAYDLVSMQGYVVAEVRDARVTMYVLRSGTHLFSATLRQSSSDAKTGVSPQIEVGSLVRVTGVCFVDSGNHWRDRLWFDLRMRSPQDVTLVELPSWWTFARLMWVVAGLGILILAAIAWVVLLGRKVQQQTQALEEKGREETASQRRFALYEQRRGEILEMISRAQPLGAILDAIVGLVSYRLHGTHCWIDLEDRWEPESRTRVPGKMAAASESLLGTDGERLGSMHLAMAFHATDKEEAREALQAGARLAELAITTQRLYQDLRHRSEFDQLTEIPNRFSFERRVTELLGRMEREGGKLALIYVDLDRFKDVNDQHGHHVGDLFLQQVAQRLKLQLRGNDMLARIGGDEFIVLLPGVRGRQEAEEVVQRLERCFAEEFVLENYQIRGSASIGLAVAPEDGVEKEELQRVADMAMYVRKEQKRQIDAELRNRYE